MNIEEVSLKYNIDTSLVEKALIKKESNNLVIFGMSGKMGSGKDTIGERIVREKELSFCKLTSLSFAFPIRTEINSIVELYNTGIDINKLVEIHNTKEEDVYKLMSLIRFNSIFSRTENSRAAIQFWGTEVRRQEDKNWWVNKTVEIILKSLAEGNSVYISDLRFPNEVEAILDLGGSVVRLVVPEEVRVDRIMFRDGIKPTQKQLNHISETGLDNYKFLRVFDGREDPKFLTRKIMKYITDDNGINYDWR